MKTGDYIKQDNTETIGLLLEQLKNGSFRVLVHDWRGRVVQKTTSGWYPEPVVINKESIPVKILNKIEKRQLLILSGHVKV